MKVPPFFIGRKKNRLMKANEGATLFHRAPFFIERKKKPPGTTPAAFLQTMQDV
jgi:hypothetical protein